MDFIRELLLRVEADPQFDGRHFVSFEVSDFPGRTDEEIAYHVELLIEGGFLKSEVETLDAPAASISRLTWSGHEFLADITDPGVWANVKERIKDLPNVAMSAIWALAQAEVRKRLHLS